MALLLFLALLALLALLLLLPQRCRLCLQLSAPPRLLQLGLFFQLFLPLRASKAP
jgi:hypothetical protein